MKYLLQSRCGRARAILEVLVWLGWGSQLGAAVYYVSPSGSDSNPGTAPATPWATLAKVNSTTYQPGDQILFARSGEWHGQLEASSDGAIDRPITYSDYGEKALSKPIFEGSDYVAAAQLVSLGNGVYSFPTSASPNGIVYWVYVNPDATAGHANLPLLAALSGGAGMPADSFFVSGGTVYINTSGADPKHAGAVVDPKSPKTAISIGDRGTGQDPSAAVISSNSHSNLVFDNLIGRETAEVGAGGHITSGLMDGYVFRVQGGSNVTLSNDEGYYGGKHIIGATDTTGFVAKNDVAEGCIDGVEGNRLPYGNATALVSYGDASQHGDTFRWIDCTVRHYSGSQPAFITHNDGAGSIKSILLQNLNALGSPIALMPGPNVAITYKGGSVQDSSLTAYTAPGTTEIIDGVKVSGVGCNISVSGNATVQNCLITGSGQDGGIQASGPHNVIRFNTIAMQGYAGSGIHLGEDAKDARLLGNLTTGTRNAIKVVGDLATVSADYDFFDASAGAPQFYVGGASETLRQFQAAGKETHGVAGDPMFAGSGGKSYSLRPGSAASNLVPAEGISGITTDLSGNVRPAKGKYDAGAYQAIGAR